METLVHPSEEEDEVLEDVVAADRAVGVKADLLHRHRGLAHSVLTVDSTDTMHLSVLVMPVRPVQAVLRSLLISAVLSHRIAVTEMDEEEIGEVVATEELDSQVCLLYTMPKAMNIRSMRTVTSYWISLRRRKLPPCSKIQKNRKTEKNQYRCCERVSRSNLSDRYWF